MGFEFIASVNGDKYFSLEKIGQELCSTNFYVLERSLPEVTSFRFSNKERRPDWPEDFCLCYQDDKLLLTIHSGTQQEQTTLMRDIKSVFNRQDVSLTFEEV